MTTAHVSCESIVLRLVEGDRGGADPELTEHIGSCLSCFRTAAELRDLPELARAMRDDAAGAMRAADPGEAFWSQLASATAERREREQAITPRPAGVAPRPVTAGAAVWTRVLGWLRMPVPAAFAGAAVAAVVAVALVEGGRLDGQVPAGEVPGPTAAATAGAAAHVMGDEEVAAPGLLGDEDPWDALESRDLRRVVAQLDAETGGGLPAAEYDGADGAELGPTLTEELESLEADDLRKVARVLPGGRGI